MAVRPLHLTIAVLVCGALSAQSGWTELTPSADSRRIHVSPAGSDQGDGRTPETAMRTIRAGLEQLRDGYPDFLLLEKGGTWNEWIHLTKSGRSAAEPLVIGSYGTGPRPILATPTDQNGIANYRGGVSHVAVVGLELTAPDYDGTNGSPVGIYLLGPFDDLLFEDLHIHNYSGGLAIQNQVNDPARFITDIALRRSVIESTYTAGSNHSQGMYIEGVDGFLVEECVFYRCGYDEDKPGSKPTIFRHACYFQVQTRNITARGNITIETASHGYQFRGSQTVAEDNFLARTAIAILLGGGDEPGLTPDGGASGTVQDNVVVYGRDIDRSKPRGFAFAGGSLRSALVKGNLFAHTDLPHEEAAPFLFGRSTIEGNIGVHNLTIEDNVVYNWRGNSISYDSPSALGSYRDVTFRNNQIQNTGPMRDPPWILAMAESHPAEWTSAWNVFYDVNSPQGAFRIGSRSLDLKGWKARLGDTTSIEHRVAYSDPDRTPERYVDHVEQLPAGSSTFQDFVTKVRDQSRDSWDSRYTAGAVNAWIRSGFGMSR